MSAYHIFIVEDDVWYSELLNYQLSLNPDYQVTRFTTATDCIKNLHKKPDLITIDYSLPDMTGAELFKKIRLADASVPVIVISGQSDVNTAVDLLKTGVSDYLVKNDNIKELLWNAVIRVRENQSLKKEVEHLREELGHKYEIGNIMVGASPAIKKIFGLIEKAAKANINVSVTGETGTGKELVAKAIHYNSDRAKKPFVALNMSAIPSELLESELFGYEKGAFTGANSRKTGKFEEANKGTLFLDEIGEMEPAMQSKLLRVLQERELTRLGGHDKVKLDVRLIVATHKNLAELVKKGTFREDFYYRIMGLPIELPPLRDRGTDILLLAKAFLDEFVKENRMPAKQLSNEAKNKLISYSFPGNVRELRSAIELAAVMCDGKEITADDLSFHTSGRDNIVATGDKTLEEYTCDIIRAYLHKYENNVVKVAQKLDIGKSTIYKMLQERKL
ncbi:sigma-54-dependent transcriptional regulator [Mucilaginibacter auburnensis]|uniref:DNA-binding NtrC family response regulator n=1 Tax=Mucilaginibacter auburnensis TaxID=1457233 RepID=A0A2H9VQA4_9SPHI|nr:sigma-54 dependent transcriptional regulator [Mucilaginibacter auburnensis]PJJ83037.1 DNA-binding NtrC family response regulator [Mucilaginibacter auburnensis]